MIKGGGRAGAGRVWPGRVRVDASRFQMTATLARDGRGIGGRAERVLGVALGSLGPPPMPPCNIAISASRSKQSHAIARVSYVGLRRYRPVLHGGIAPYRQVGRPNLAAPAAVLPVVGTAL